MENGALLQHEEKEFSRRYKWSLWWVEHRAGLKRLALILFGILDGVLAAIALWGFTDAYLVSRNREFTAVEAMATQGQDDLHAYTVATAGKPLQLGAANVFGAGEGRFDFYAPLANPNEDWWAEFTYTFQSGAGETRVEKGFIMPAEEKPLISLAFESATPPAGPKLVLSDFRWHRVDHHVTGSAYAAFAQDRLNFPIRDVSLAPAVEGDQAAPPRVVFTVENETAFGYYDVAFEILLKRGTAVVGVNRAVLSRFDEGSTQNVTVNWFGPLPSASSVEVKPSVNVFDPSVYQRRAP
jgi:hypothetical protein